MLVDLKNNFYLCGVNTLSRIRLFHSIPDRSSDDLCFVSKNIRALCFKNLLYYPRINGRSYVDAAYLLFGAV